jgi:hypothetical protein
MRNLNFLLGMFMLLSIGTMTAQNSGRGFNFQSLIRNQEGQILKSTAIQIFLKYYLEGTSDVLFEESHSVTTDDFGAVSLVTGYGQKVSGSLDKYSDINFGSGNIWYAVSIMDEGVKREIANQRFYSVPYAETAFNVSPVPAGTILPFAGENVPIGYLSCDGAEYSKSDYPELYAAVQNIWGTTTNNNNFKVPDLRGLFLRGVDGTANRDPNKNTRAALIPGQNSGNRVGSYQSDAIQNITGSVGPKYFGQGGMSASDGKGAFRGTPVSATAGGTTRDQTNRFGGFNFDASRVVRTSTETRPANINILYIIKI